MFNPLKFLFMYKVHFTIYNAHDLTQIRLVSTNVTTQDLIELLPLVHISFNNFYSSYLEVPIYSHLRMFFTGRTLIRYLRFINSNHDSDICFIIDKISRI